MSDNKTKMNSASDAIENVLERFEAAWRELTYPSIRDFVPSPLSSESSALLFDLVKIDIDRRYERAFSADCEQETETASTAKAPRLTWYAEQFPELGSIDDWPTDVIAVEYRVRKEFGFNPSFDEYRERFPDRSEGLKIAVEAVDRELLEHGRTVISTFHRTTKPKKQDANFGDYEIIEKIGQGGMGVVYKARHRPLNRIVALKTIRADQSEGEALQRFQTECEAAATLQHPGIVPVFESGEVDGRLYYSMPFIDGVNLPQMVTDSSGLPPREAAAIMRAVADAIQYAHERGVIHRDLKPRNVLIDAHGEPRIADFGLARLLESEAGLTETGRVMGTFQFMSPEQAKGATKDVGPSSDVYSLGATLYFLLTGQPPFDSENAVDIRRQILEDEPRSLRSLNGLVDRDLETICHKALEKEPNRRYTSAADLGNELRRFLNREPITARPISRAGRFYRWCRRHPARAAICVIASISIIASIGWATVQARYAYLKKRAGVLEGDKEQLAAEAGELRQDKSEIAADRTKIQRELISEKAASNNRKSSIYYRNIGLAHAAWKQNRVADAKRLLGACWPSLRRWEWYYLSRLVRFEVLSVKHPSPLSIVAFGPKSDRVAVGDRSGSVTVYLVPSGKRLWSVNIGKLAIHSISFRSDGAVLTCNDDKGDVILFDSNDGKICRRIPAKTASCVAFDGAGKYLAIGHADGSLAIREAGSKDHPVVHRAHLHKASVRRVYFSNRDKLISTVGADGTMCVLDVSTKKHKAISKKKRLFVDAAFQAGGRWIVTADNRQFLDRWNAATATFDDAIGQSNDRIMCLDCTAAGYVAIGGWDNNVSIWDQRLNHRLYSFRGHTAAVTDVAFEKEGRLLASVSEDGTLRVWDVMRRQAAVVAGRSSWPERHSNTPGITAVSIGQRGREIITGRLTGQIGSWHAGTGRFRGWYRGNGRQAVPRQRMSRYSRRMMRHRGRVRDLSVSKSGRVVVSLGGFQEVFIWDGFRRTFVASLRRITSAVSAISVSPDGSQVAVAFRTGRLDIWSVSSRNRVAMWKAHVGEVTDVAFSSDGKLLVSSGKDGKITIWDADTKRRVGTLEHRSAVTCFTISGNGELIAAAELDNTISVWQTATGIRLARCVGHRLRVTACTFNRTSDRIASCGYDGTLRIWSAKTGESILVLDGHGKYKQNSISRIVHGVQFNSLRKQIVTAGHDGTLRIWSGDMPIRQNVRNR